MSITPPPWNYVTDCHGNISFESGVIWADREGNIVIDDDDARLIAAAPDLLYAATLLSELGEVLGENNAAVVIARAAIAKAGAA